MPRPSNPMTRNNLIDASLRIMDVANGVNELTVDMLANTLHMSKSTLYKHFEGLDELINAAVETVCIRAEDDLILVPITTNPMDTFRTSADIYARHVSRMPVGLLTQRGKLPNHSRLRLENTEERLGERVFRAAIGTGAPSAVAHGIRAAYEGTARALRTVPAEQRGEHIAALTDAMQRALTV